jgi:hypothetical protein
MQCPVYCCRLSKLVVFLSGFLLTTAEKAELRLNKIFVARAKLDQVLV